MKTLELNGNVVCLVPPPNLLHHIGYNEAGVYLQFTAPTNWLPSGNWSILGWSDEITEEQAKGIVEIKEHHGYVPIYRDYVKEGQVIKGAGFTSEIIGYDTALESFQSLLAKEGITDRVLVIVESK